MKIRNRVLAAAAVLTLTGGTALAGATAASASSTGCAFSNGCATLHGTDAAGNTVAMDAKYQNKTEILIGYPDNVGDNATSFDGVLHYTRPHSVTAWNDTGLSQWTLDSSPSPTPAPSPEGSFTIAGFTYNGTTGCLEFTVSGGTAPYSAALSGVAGATVTVADGDGGGESSEGPETSTAEAAETYDGAICVNGDNLTPGVYHNVTLTVTDSYKNPLSASETFAVKVYGVQVTVPGGSTPFYTFVYAPHGDWTSQCVTDINGSGALRLAACTLGRDKGQDFTVDSGNGLLSGSQAHLSNLLAAAVGSSSCLTDPSTSNPAVKQSDATDEVAPGGRQLYVNGSCAANANLWSWGT